LAHVAVVLGNRGLRRISGLRYRLELRRSSMAAWSRMAWSIMVPAAVGPYATGSRRQATPWPWAGCCCARIVPCRSGWSRCGRLGTASRGDWPPSGLRPWYISEYASFGLMCPRHGSRSCSWLPTITAAPWKG
jgi:hypothetical protein